MMRVVHAAATTTFELVLRAVRSVLITGIAESRAANSSDGIKNRAVYSRVNVCPQSGVA